MGKQEYQRFDPKAYEERRSKQEGPKRELNVPEGMDEILDDINDLVEQDNLSEHYKQHGGQ